MLLHSNGGLHVESQYSAEIATLRITKEEHQERLK